MQVMWPLPRRARLERSERGQHRQQGERTDLKMIKDAIKNGLSLRELNDKYELTLCQQKIAENYMTLFSKKR